MADQPIPPHATWLRFPRYIGDAVMQMALLRLLRQVDAAPLVVWGPKLTVSLVEGTDLADAVLRDEGKPGPLAMAGILRRHRARRSIHFPKSLRPALAAFLARVPERIGVSESLAGPFNTHTLPFWRGEGHCLERYARVLRLRWPDLPPLPFVDYRSPFRAQLPDQPFLCLMPGASVPEKAWPAAQFREVAVLAKAAGLRPVALGGPSEKDLGEEVVGGLGLNRCGDTLAEAAAWMSASAASLGNDSGLSHLAAACGTPTLALHGTYHQDQAMFTPWGPVVRVLRAERLEALTPEEVWRALEPFLRG